MKVCRKEAMSWIISNPLTSQDTLICVAGNLKLTAYFYYKIALLVY